MYSSKIICPKCGREYLAGEIFIPKEFIGRPTLIERDTFGKVIFSNDDLDLKEEYVCDKCGSKL